MGRTYQSLKEEVKNAYRSVLNELREDEKKLPKKGKEELREYLVSLRDNKIHAYSTIFISRKLRELQQKYAGQEDTVLESSGHDLDEHVVIDYSI